MAQSQFINSMVETPRDIGNGEGRRRIDFAVARPVERIIRSDGIHDIIEAVGTSTEALENTRSLIEQTLGGNVRILGQSASPRGSFFGFSSGRWNATWNPPGPRRNWAAPKNPSQN